MKQSIKLLHWLPRIICILAILFVSLFALDAFDPQHTIWEQIIAFIMHLIPSFILIVLLFVAWKWELIGGIIFSLIGIVFTPIIFHLNYNINDSVWLSIGIIMSITFPFFLVGILFILSYFKKKKYKQILEAN